MLITGVTGKVGAALAQCLLSKDIPFRAAARNPSHIPQQLSLDDRVDVKELDFSRSHTYKYAFSGISTMFLVVPPDFLDIGSLEEALKAAKECGVQYVLFLSYLGSEKMMYIPHRKIERMLMRMGFQFIFLRTSFFMQNLVTDVKQNHEIYYPSGNGEVSFVDARDVAEAACLSMRRKFRNEVYYLTGKQAFSYAEIARILSDELGYQVTFRNYTKHQFMNRCEQAGLSAKETLLLANLYTSAKNGTLKKVTRDAEKILGRSPTDIREFINDYKSAFHSQMSP
ncbi:NmrA family NAD(P)-binding protein [Halobacillus rhizosphaerae]|uniref:NmrA family NAD(P)-binding protein n=1 Tax=Halobacillus rhizosphaerae TaxID=3064889 RepID=UPI00398B2E2E